MTTTTPASAQEQVDALRWPDVAARPPAPLRAAVAWRLFRRVVRTLPIVVELPGGRAVPTAARRPDAPVLRINRPAEFAARIGRAGTIGFGESYLAGDWTATDLVGVLTPFAARLTRTVPPPLAGLRRWVLPRAAVGQHGAIEQTGADIAAHYDLSNDMFALWLDSSLTYSAALFDQDAAGRPIATEDTFTAAQHRKIDRLLDLTGVGPDRTVLEIGTGWGELAIRAAARGARVVSLTLSARQRDLARQRIAAAGLTDRISVELCDYRQAAGRHDAILSVEMIEAVGYRYWPVYVRTLADRLAPGGRIGLQLITMPHRRMLATRDTFTWITKYVFPGGLLPSLTAIDELVAANGLRVTDRLAIGPHYAQTLRLWRERFGRAGESVTALGFDRTFCRMWTFYLAYCEAGFRAGYLDVHQLIVERAG